MNLRSKILNIKPPKIAMAYLAVMYGLRILLSDYSLGATPFRMVGIGLFFGGFAVMMSAVLLFRKYDTVLQPTERPRVLITEGPYRFSRNPIYFGMACMLAGISLVLGSALMLIAPLAFLLTVDQIFVPFEEKMLAEVFDRQYPEYQKQVRRWI